MPKKQKDPIVKSIVETTGNFGLLNTNGEYIQPDRPSVVTNTQFVEQRIYTKEIKVLAHNLPDKASDLQFLDAFLSAEKDTALAVASYAAEFGLDTSGEKLSEKEYESDAQRKKRIKLEEDQRKKAAAELKKKEEEEAAELKKKEEEEAAELKKKEEEEAAAVAAAAALEKKDDEDDAQKSIDTAGDQENLNG